MNPSIDILLKNAKTGDDLSREKLIQYYRPYVIKVVANICRRPVQWDEDETSISLIALNEAIDRYNDSFGKSFESFAYTVIHNRLTDEFRRRSRTIKTESFDMVTEEGFELSKAEIATSMEQFKRQTTAHVLAQELLFYRQRLLEFGICFDELEDNSPEHRDTRIQLIRIAKEFSKNSSWINMLEQTKKLPLKEMVDYVTVSKKTLERHRKYLISLILIYSYEDFSLIRSAVSFSDLGE